MTGITLTVKEFALIDSEFDGIDIPEPEFDLWLNARYLASGNERRIMTMRKQLLDQGFMKHEIYITA